MSKSSQSGLRTIRRDWSESSLSSQGEIPWPSSQPQTSSSQSSRPSQAGSDKRLKAIQDALNGKTGPTKPLGPSAISNKRPSPAASQGSQGSVAKKARQLPPNWQNPSDTLSTSSWGNNTSHASKTITGMTKKPDSKVKKIAPVFLSQEQTQILKLVQEEENVFYTGSAGTGKSVLLREIIKTLRRKYSKSPDAIAITASTGIAACNIGGVTIHSFAGIGLGIESAKDLAKKVRKNRKASARWLRTKVLIIDEVSMVDGDLFDKLAEIGSILRGKQVPFGGIQIIVTGDFFQLPPVAKGTNQVKFAFEASMWGATIKRTFNLTKVFRQRDQEFVDMLNEMRFGRLTERSIAKFRSLSRPVVYEDGLLPTELFPRREDVERSNHTRMSQLQGQEQVFKALDGGTIQDEQQRTKMLANFMAPARLVLRQDAQVMLIKNTDEMLVNGSMGRVLRFVDPSKWGTEADDESGIGPPLVVGSTGDAKSKDKKPAAAVGEIKLYPVVEFLLPHGGTRQVLVVPEVWKVELPDGEVQVSRTQLPLIPSWAMSIHKSQGQTLERVKVDLGRVFEKGQAYVALSRATCLDGLQVLNFVPSKVQAHPKVVEWSQTLETVSE
ncbi:hypothetical protein HGRIS_014925 [Hohenbuehelia grisea]|uniref:ATP-dependent DNA helicase PIF1 n=1 Tax=Hohenbuehelia grisea TaxID=104357 RepID=A0ABR3JDG0_9AGAR